MTALSPAYPAVPADALAIRLETPADDDWIENLHEVSFGPGRFARAAFRVRERFPIDPSLCFIAELDGVRAASVRLTPISVGGIDGYLLGPLMTDPAFRKQGAGRALVRHACDLALGREGAGFVLLVGDLAYYGPLGFIPTVPHAIRFPAPVDPARVLVHSLDENMATTLAGDIGRFGKG
ncbi:GNAT family N-acetyltransferase [Pelagibacterium limicola]|uniref:GNAT family N-acetyltransferase n=1 Tax=Pelagibacterium limicola TaxID=2791022 RepID=UPI0018AFB43F|nr:N-acetyltransferase [Pelagibacterium limicola]